VTNAVVRTNGNGHQVAAPTEDRIGLIRRTICAGATNDEIQLFLYQAERTGLDPLARQIYAVKRWDSQQGREVMSIQVSIDGFRLIAERTGKYVGQLGPLWCGEDCQWWDAWTSNSPPAAARVGVLRSDFKEPCWGVARFGAYAQRKKDGSPTRMWSVMPDVMTAKCAEALALRRAFPQELSGLYTNEEMQQANDESAIKPLPKKNARDIYNKLQQEIAGAKTAPELKRWGEAAAERIAVMPLDWQDILRARYAERVVELKQLGANDDPRNDAEGPVESAERILSQVTDPDMLEPTWDYQVAPTMDGLPTEQQEAILGAYRKHEKRLAP
jgi:phage recombination protein Bet